MFFSTELTDEAKLFVERPTVGIYQLVIVLSKLICATNDFVLCNQGTTHAFKFVVIIYLDFFNIVIMGEKKDKN